MDNQATESSSTELTIEDAGKAFAELIEPTIQAEPEPKVDTELDPPKKKEEGEKEAEPNAAEEGDDAPLTIEVDGKQVSLTKAEIAEAYKNGLRQADYTRKTMEAADTRKAADAEIQKTQQERAAYAQNLVKMAAQLEGAIQQQEKIDWRALLATDPVEYLKQQHLYQEASKALQANQQEQQHVQQLAQSDAAKAREARLSTQQQELLAKLPDWKDATKAATEKKAIGEYLLEQGYTAAELNIEDHRAIVLSRKAMLYDQMMAKAKAVAKKVENLPTRVMQPGTASERNPLDGRNAAMQRHAKQGTVESAAAVFANLLS